MIDSGCGYDLIGAQDADRYPGALRATSAEVQFTTANGATTSRATINLQVDELRQGVSRRILASTPAVLSLGRRCMHEGFSFVWPSGETPYLILPDGMIVRLKVTGDIPYIVPSASLCQPVSPQSDITFPSTIPNDDQPTLEVL